MINLIVYLPKNNDPVALLQHLLTEKLIASGSIDEDNNAFVMMNDKLEKQINFVITMQTQALLFTEIANYIELQYGLETAMYANPIVASNNFFYERIRTKTKQKKASPPSED